MSMRKRYLEHMKEKKALPEGFDCGSGMAKGYSSGGMVESEEWMDGEWNDHDDSSGEPDGYAFGGMIKAPEHGDEGSPEMSEEELKQHLAKSLMRRKQLRPGA